MTDILKEFSKKKLILKIFNQILKFENFLSHQIKFYLDFRSERGMLDVGFVSLFRQCVTFSSSGATGDVFCPLLVILLFRCNQMLVALQQRPCCSWPYLGRTFALVNTWNEPVISVARRFFYFLTGKSSTDNHRRGCWNDRKAAHSFGNVYGQFLQLRKPAAGHMTLGLMLSGR